MSTNDEVKQFVGMIHIIKDKGFGVSCSFKYTSIICSFHVHVGFF